MYRFLAGLWPPGGIALLLAGCICLAVSERARATEPAADNGAVVVMYHRFGEEIQGSANIRLDQFDAHIAELTSGRYQVLPLPEIVSALTEGRKLPDRSIAVTIDGAFTSVFTEAWPRLRKAGLPFTLFLATDPIDGNFPDYMNWHQLREMVAGGGVTIGTHGLRHRRVIAQSESDTRAEIARASARLRAELGISPKLFAYPYGEFDLGLRDLVAAAGYLAAFGQHSGAIARTADRHALPRFALNEVYGDLKRFRLVVNALPIPVIDMTPADPLLDPANNPPSYGFTVTEEAGKNLESLNCYAIGLKLEVENLGSGRVEVRSPAPFKPGRNRINCTLPGPDGRWRWLGRQFYLPDR